jgi:hypothetical protein
MWDTNYMVQGVNEYEPTLSTYSPAYPTGKTNKVGHYVYFNAQGDASTCILNCSNYLGGTGGDGGFQFHQCSSTLNPQRLMKVDTTQVLVTSQFKVDKSSSPSPPIYSPNILNLSPDNSHINFATDLRLPPYNFGSGVSDNPIYLTQTNGFYTTGELAYAFLTAPTQIQIFRNNNITNPIPPNTFPSDFPNTNTTGLTVGIPIFTLSPILPSIAITAELTDTLTLTNDTDTSVLSSTDLTFNSVSVISQIRDLQIKQISTINQNISAAIYADGRPPTAPTTTISQQYAYSPSWYFKNTVAGYKINWYLPAPAGLYVGDILGLYIAFFNGANTYNANTPFITVYTTPTGSGDYAPNFYHSANTYVFNGTIAANTRYTEFINLSSCPTPNSYATTLRSMIQSPVSPNPRGSYLPTEPVAFFSIGTNSAAAVNTLEIAVSKFGIMLSSGTTEINFFPV